MTNTTDYPSDFPHNSAHAVSVFINDATQDDSAASSASAVEHVQVVIIGAGTAGQSAYKQLRKHTDSIRIINAGKWTTTCAEVGCMPSKLLIAAAERAHHAAHSTDFGIEADVVIDGAKVMQRVHTLRDFFTGHVQADVDTWEEAHKIQGTASLSAEGIVTVGAQRFSFDHLIIAIGSTPTIPDGWQSALADRLLTSDSVFELPTLPRSLSVVGAGAIGLELAQAFARLGVAVTLFNRGDKIGGINDPDINAVAKACFMTEPSLHLALNSSIDTVSTTTDDAQETLAVIDYLDASGQRKRWQGQYVLVAIGRHTELEALGVAYLGIALDERGYPVDFDHHTGQVKTSLHHGSVYIVGDANGSLPLLHVANHEGYEAGISLVSSLRQESEPEDYAEQKHTGQKIDDEGNAQNDSDKQTPLVPLSIVFSEPQIAQVGASLPSLTDKGIKPIVGAVDFGRQGRSRVMGVNRGRLHLYVHPHNQRLLGGCMIAPDAEYIAHLLALAIEQQMTIEELLTMPYYHPTILEGLKTALRDAKRQFTATPSS